jgi:sulfide:quinone oxidoreductase
MTKIPIGTLLGATVLCFTPYVLPPHQLSAQARPALTLPMPGIDTFHPVTTTVALGSNARPEAMTALKQAGIDVVVVIREDREEGYDRAEAERAATEAGLRFVSIPFTRLRPDPAAAHRFLEVMAAPENSHAYIYCHEGPRAATMWMIKRVRQDGWTLDRAMAEAESLGLARPELKKFATEFLSSSRP